MNDGEADQASAHDLEPVADRPLIRMVADWVRGITGIGSRDPSLRESLEEIFQDHEESDSPVDEQERTMLLNLLNFGELRVENVMVPRADIVAVPETANLAEVVAAMSDAGHSRLPVYRDTLDEVIGMIHVRDLLAFWHEEESFVASQVVRAMPFVPPSMPIQNLLRQMRATKVHMALVVDEHGGIDGLVTIEDLVEEIVGEIEDEHDRAKPPSISVRPDGSYDADARLLIEDLEPRLGCDLLPSERDEEIDTLGGLVIALAGRVPITGEVIGHEAGLDFEIVDADPRRVRSVRIRRRGGGEPLSPVADS
jgi:CBS domain containing-hemolysin-like protein